jgi:hypothetical protein
VVDWKTKKLLHLISFPRSTNVLSEQSSISWIGKGHVSEHLHVVGLRFQDHVEIALSPLHVPYQFASF